MTTWRNLSDVQMATDCVNYSVNQSKPSNIDTE